MGTIDDIVAGGLDEQGRTSSEVAVAVARRALALTPEQLEALIAMEASFSQELATVCEAARQIGDGNDEAGLEALRRIGLKSPFRQAKLFLRGLSAFYRGRDDEAHRAFRSISRDHAQWPAAEALLCVLEPEAADRDVIMRAAPVLQALGLHRAADGLLLGLVQRHLKRGRLNAALRAASKVMQVCSDRLAETLRRDVPAAMLAAGIDRESVIERVNRAFPHESGELRHLLDVWLAEASGDLDHAIQGWTIVADCAAEGRYPRLGAYSPVVTSAISEHIGGLFVRCARSDDDHSRSSSSTYRLRSRRHSPLWSRAYAAFADAVDLDPSNAEAWKGQLEAASYLADRRVRVRVLEAYIKQFPESAEAIIAAAQASGERGAYDKGLRFVRRAAELEPLNRSIRDIEAWLLCGKGRKKHRSGDERHAKRCYGEARSLAMRCTRGQRLRVLAAIAAYDLVSEGGEVESLERQVLSDELGPWLWRGLTCIEIARLVERRRRPGRGVPPRPRRIPTIPKPGTPPTSQEVSALLSLVVENEENHGFRPPELYRLISRSLEAGGTLLTARDDLDLALALAQTPSLRLRLAERAHELWPMDPQFVSIRYSTALILRLPGEYFDRARSEIDSARRALTESFEAHRADYTPAAARALRVRIDAIERHLDVLIEDISRYCVRTKTSRESAKQLPSPELSRQLSLFNDE